MIRGLHDPAKPPFLQCGIVISVHLIQGNNSTSRKVVKKADDKICTDKTGRSGDEYAFMVQVDLLFFHVFLSAQWMWFTSMPLQKICAKTERKGEKKRGVLHKKRGRGLTSVVFVILLIFFYFFLYHARQMHISLNGEK